MSTVLSSVAEGNTYREPIHVPSNRPEIRRILQATFPNYRKRSVVVDVFRGPRRMNSYWDGGTKEEYHLFRLDTGQVGTVPDSHPYFDRRQDGSRCGILELRELPPNTVLVEGGTFCGKPATVHIYTRPDGLTPALEAPKDELPAPQAKALAIIRAIKGGCRDEYFRRAGLCGYGPDNVYVQALAEKGYVKISKSGAVCVTVEGENVPVPHPAQWEATR